MRREEIFKTFLKHGLLRKTDMLSVMLDHETVSNGSNNLEQRQKIILRK
jgi:hypothetical protein